LAMDVGGCARAAPAAAVHSGERGRKKGASRAACGSGGAVLFDWDREGVEERIGWRPWSSTRPAMAATAIGGVRA
jgi:hypothetical protein